MLFDWNTIAFPASVQDLQLSAPSPSPAKDCGCALCPAASALHPYLLPGRCRWVQRSFCRRSPCLPGTILSRAPLALVPESICHLLCVQLTGQAASQFLAGLHELPFLAKGGSCPAAAELMDRLAEEKAAHSRARSQLAYALLCELADADSAASALPPLVQAAIEDIRANYAGLYGVEELSERLGVSKSHLVRTFTAAIGVPPGKYLTTVRVEAAQRLLLHREYTLDVVASLCGFSGANYLCRVFKKETGQSPAQWRAMAGHAAQSGLSPEESLREQELYI